VFELGSCRECGAVYYLAWARVPKSAPPDFLWSEPSGDLSPLQLLAEAPRDAGNDPRVLEIDVQRTTGAVLEGRHPLGADEVRRLWAPFDHETHGVAEGFRSCPMCQPVGGRRQTRVLDFRTKGEQSFTALIEAQFAEQPPQKDDPTLPNRGRKVLVFSDGRQKAARLAPALETNHAADVFRQVLALAARALRELGDPGQMHRLYPAILHVCARRAITLFPNEERRAEFDQHLAAARGKDLRALLDDASNGFFAPPVPYADALFREMTDRFFSLTAIGLATIGPSPTAQMARDFPSVGLTPAEVDVLLRHWLRMQIEARRFILPNFTRFSIGEDWERPEATESAFDRGWFRTGDRAERDATGAVRLLGRTSVDILKSGGYKLSALEIEETLREHPAVREVAVVGLPDETWGERVAAAIVPAPGREAEVETEPLRAWRRTRPLARSS
jgi:hypothetical protein